MMLVHKEESFGNISLRYISAEIFKNNTINKRKNANHFSPYLPEASSATHKLKPRNWGSTVTVGFRLGSMFHLPALHHNQRNHVHLPSFLYSCQSTAGYVSHIRDRDRDMSISLILTVRRLGAAASPGRRLI